MAHRSSTSAGEELYGSTPLRSEDDNVKEMLFQAEEQADGGQGLVGGAEHHAGGDKADSIVHIALAITAEVKFICNFLRAD